MNWGGITTMPKALIAGNWKMNGNIGTARELAGAIAAGVGTHVCDYLICPPFTALSEVSNVLDGGDVRLGAQDCHTASSGAYTGDISVEMCVFHLFRSCVSDRLSFGADATATGFFFIQTFHTSIDLANIACVPKQHVRVTIKAPTKRAPVF